MGVWAVGKWVHGCSVGECLWGRMNDWTHIETVKTNQTKHDHRPNANREHESEFTTSVHLAHASTCPKATNHCSWFTEPLVQEQQTTALGSRNHVSKSSEVSLRYLLFSLSILKSSLWDSVNFCDNFENTQKMTCPPLSFFVTFSKALKKWHVRHCQFLWRFRKHSKNDMVVLCCFRKHSKNDTCHFVGATTNVFMTVSSTSVTKNFV